MTIEEAQRRKEHRPRIRCSRQALRVPLDTLGLRDSPDDWYRWSADDGGPRAMTTGLGDIDPLFTNGTLVIGTLGDGRHFLAHITNVTILESEKSFKFINRKRSTTPSSKPSSRKKERVVHVAVDDLL